MPNNVIAGGRPRLLRIRIKRGINLAVRDALSGSSDPYVFVELGKQKLKTRVINKNLNPEWNQDFNLSITDCNVPIKLTVYDYDKFTKDDKMGDVEFNINDLPSSTINSTINPTIDRRLKLKNVGCGEVEIQLQWINLPNSQSS